MKKIIGVYKITSPTGRVYIGSSSNIKNRKYHYKKLNCKRQPKLFASIKKYGWESHIFEIIEECMIGDLYRKEYEYGILYKVLDRGNLNCRLPKIYENKKVVSEDTLEKMAKVQRGKKASKETRLKMSLSQKGRKHSIETREKQKYSNSNLKIVLNLETGIFYYGTKEASDAINMNRHTLKNKLNGSKPNDTSFMYI